MGCMARSPGRGPVHGLDHKRAAMLTCVWHDVYLSYRTSGGLTFANRPATISSFTVSGNDQGAMPAAGYALAPCLGLHPRFISAGACAVLCLTSRTMFFVLSAVKRCPGRSRTRPTWPSSTRRSRRSPAARYASAFKSDARDRDAMTGIFQLQTRLRAASLLSPPSFPRLPSSFLPFSRPSLSPARP